MDDIVNHFPSTEQSNESPLIHPNDTKKRKFNQFGMINTNAHGNEPLRKKRKCTDSNTHTQSNILKKENNDLIQRNDTLIQNNSELRHENTVLSKEKNYYQQSVHTYKKEINKWKSKWKKLQSQMQSNHSTNRGQLPLQMLPSLTTPIHTLTLYDASKENGMTQVKKENICYDSIRERLLSMGYDKAEINNRISFYDGSGKSAQFVFEQILHTFTFVPLLKTENNEFVQFEQSYIVSVDCHLCTQHFSDMIEYREHIKHHYNTDRHKQWLKCDFIGCENKAKFKSSPDIIGHIAIHTNDKPYHCNITQNGIKCTHSTGYKGDLKRHWKKHFFEPEIAKDKSKHKKTVVRKAKHGIVKFEDSFGFLVDCHMCNKRFSEYNKYKLHLELHYTTDATKEWKKCDFGCKRVFTASDKFIEHIASHTKHKPFKCNVGACVTKTGCKGNMRQHWRHFHSPKANSVPTLTQKTKHKNRKKRTVNNEFIEFEDSYYFTVSCHMCNTHFDDMPKYREHLEAHYNDDLTKKWLKCDFGCDKKIEKSQEFIGHIAQHLNNKPFVCNLTENGMKCTYATRYKWHIKTHWKNHFKSRKQLQYINTATVREPKKPQKPIRKGKKRMGNDINISKSNYHISVNCHICDIHFNDISQYCSHLQTHYRNDMNKQWLKCDFMGCDQTTQLFCDKNEFISHIATHTSKNPFKCDGLNCGQSFASVNAMKAHYKNGHKMHQSKKRQRSKVAIVDTDFENSYIVSVHCHVCNTHFCDLSKYRKHIKEHYRSDPSKTWLHCDFGCEKVFGDQTNWICHIAYHTNERPFKCAIKVNGNTCVYSAGTKSNQKSHWNSMHNPVTARKKKGKKSERARSNDSDSDSESEYSESDSGSAYESSDSSDSGKVNEIFCESHYYVSAECHMCEGRHFDDFTEYRVHIRDHFEKDPNKTWMHCDFGCRDAQNKPRRFTKFMNHLATHTKVYPFHCSVKGCSQSCGRKASLKEHWNRYHRKCDSDGSEESETESDWKR